MKSLILTHWIDLCIASVSVSHEAKECLKLCKTRIIENQQEIKNLDEETQVLSDEINRLKEENAELKKQVNVLEIENEF